MTSKLPSHVVVGPKLEPLLKEFERKSVNAIIWDRGPTRASDFIQMLHPSKLPGCRRLVYKNKLLFGFEVGCKLPSIAERTYSEDWIKDLIFLVALRKQLKHKYISPLANRYPSVDVRKGRTAEPFEAGRFHTDGYARRILVTYRGPTTLWVSNKDPKIKFDKRTDTVYLKPGAKRFSVPLNSVVIFKGYQDGFIHSAPEETNDRLLVTVDW